MSKRTPQNVKLQACDCCKKRKTKCDRDRPCDRCLEAGIVCTYDTVPLRRGRTGKNARVLSALRSAQSSTPNPPDIQHTELDSITTAVLVDCTSPPEPSSHASFLPFDLANPSPTSALDQISVRTRFFAQYASQRRPTAESRQVPGRITSVVITAHVHVFLKHLFPIMPIVDPEKLIQDCNNLDVLSEKEYTFLVALCAATRIQLGLDYADSSAPPSSRDPQRLSRSAIDGNGLLTEVAKMRQKSDILDDPDCTTLLTSFFLFAAYGNLNDQKRALFYLHQAISFAFMLGLHEESTYIDLAPSEAEQQRKVFWLLFISERAYALQLSKPVLLSPSIRKPEVFSSDNPRLLFGFLNLIRLFEKLKPSLYCRNTSSNKAGITVWSNAESLHSIRNEIATFEPPMEEVVETQKVDILVTRDWLQVALSTLEMREQDMSTFGLSLVSCAKTVMGSISKVSRSCVAAHGIGMEQKLYDIAASTAKALSYLPESSLDTLAGAIVNPRDLIWEYIRVLSDIRGNPSYLLPKLVECSNDLLRLNTPLSSPSFCVPGGPIVAEETEGDPTLDMLANISWTYC